MVDRYTSIKLVLKELGINSYNDYQARVNEWEKTGMRLCRGSQRNIDSLRQLVVDDFQRFKLQPLLGQYISINPDQIQNIQMDNYMCIFPNHILVETDTLFTRIPSKSFTTKYDLPPNDYFKQFFRYEPLIKRNIVNLYPVKEQESISDYPVRKTFDEILEYSPVAPLENVVYASQEGNLSRVVQRADYFYVAFPWLYNANTDVYLEICDKYPAEFENLSNAIEKISRASNCGDNFNDNVLRELRDALINIQIAFDKKRSLLKSKGITTVLGWMLTCIPFALSALFHNIDPQLCAGIIGNTSLVKSTDLLNDFFGSKSAGIEDPFWVIWKWKNSIL